MWISVLLLLYSLHHISAQEDESLIIDAMTEWSKEAILGLPDLTKDLSPTDLLPEYDFIVIGAGSAGSAVAARLSEESSWKVLLIEAGHDETAESEIPLAWSSLSKTHYNWRYHTKPDGTTSQGLNNKRAEWPSGRAMGGGSAINSMFYVRGCAAEYNELESMGNTGWGWDNVTYYFKKSERASGDFENSPMHYQHGVLSVERLHFETELGDIFLEAGKEKGCKVIDYNSGESLGFSKVQVTQRNGSRCSANKAFLRPAKDRQNLHIVKLAYATKILFNKKKKVTGVEFLKTGELIRISVSKEVILSTGAINSPKLLMLSGIGPKNHLRSHKIPIIHDLKGVGRNLQDAIGYLGLIFLINESISLTTEQMALQEDFAYPDYMEFREGSLTSIGVGEALAFFKCEHHKSKFDYPDLELILTPTHLGLDQGKALKDLANINDENYDAAFAPLAGKPGFTIIPLLLHPESSGYVELKSSNPFLHPKLVANYLKHEDDVHGLIEAINVAINLTKTQAFQKYDAKLSEFKIPACKNLEFASDAYWECALRQLTLSVWHFLGTAKMGPASDPMAVVDPELRVYGVKGLRVIDASIIPKQLSAHTSAPAVMIGEKGADMIKCSYGKC